MRVRTEMETGLREAAGGVDQNGEGCVPEGEIRS